MREDTEFVAGEEVAVTAGASCDARVVAAAAGEAMQRAAGAAGNGGASDTPRQRGRSRADERGRRLRARTSDESATVGGGDVTWSDLLREHERVEEASGRRIGDKARGGVVEGTAAKATRRADGREARAATCSDSGARRTGGKARAAAQSDAEAGAASGGSSKGLKQPRAPEAATTEERQLASHDELRRLHAAGLPAAECGVIAKHVQKAVEIAVHDEPDDGAGVFGWDATSGAMAWSVVTKALAHAWHATRDGRRSGGATSGDAR